MYLDKVPYKLLSPDLPNQQKAKDENNGVRCGDPALTEASVPYLSMPRSINAHSHFG